MPCDTNKRVSNEDVELAVCLKQIGIFPLIPIDEHGHLNFSRFNLINTMFQETVFCGPKHRDSPAKCDIKRKFNETIQKWFKHKVPTLVSQGRECCSNNFISFHYMAPQLMEVTELLIYSVTQE